MKQKIFLSGFCILLALLQTICCAADSAAVTSKEMAQRATNALMAARKLEIPDGRQVTQLILDEKFSEFEERSKKYEALFQKDPLYESPLFKLYSAIGWSEDTNAYVTNPDRLIQKLDKWARTRPSYISYGARGYFKVDLGFRLRGDKYISETPKENVEKMREMHEGARRDLELALKENRQFPLSYMGLIKIEQASGGVEDATRMIKLADNELPHNYYVRATYLQSLHPRWGGSYEKMDRYTSRLDGAAVGNPRIWSLKGEVDAERGYSAVLAKNYQGAINHYTRAISYGDRLGFRYWRGRMYMELSRNELALADFLKFREYGASTPEIEGYIQGLSK